MKSISQGFFARFIFISVAHETNELKELAQSLEKLVDGELLQFTKWMDGQAASLDDERKQELYEFYSDEYYKYNEVFPTRIRSALVTTSYSILESNLFRLCENLGQEHGLRIGPRDLSDKGIRQAFNYMVKVLELPISESKEWRELRIINLLRNAIVHEQGRIHKSNDELGKYVRKMGDYLELKSNLELLVKGPFIPYVLDLILRFFRELEMLIFPPKDQARATAQE